MKTAIFATASAALLLALAGSVALHAQKVPAAAPAVSDDDEVVILSEFTVAAQKLENSYIATETTATRIGDKIIDLPYNVEIFTEDFIQDFNTYTDASLIAYIPASTGGETGSSDLKVRGFSILKTRDGFQYSMPAASHVMKEFISGPASILYGRAVPGGILNAISPRPRQKPSVKARASISNDNDSVSLSLIATGPIVPGGKLFYHAYIEYQTAGNLEKYAGSDDYFAGLALLYKFNRDTALTLTFEYQPTRGAETLGTPVLVNSANITTANGYSATQVTNITKFTSDPDFFNNNPSSSIPGPNANNKGIRYWTGVGDFSMVGPDALRKVQFYGLNLLLEHRINNIWSFRLSGQTKAKDTFKTRWVMTANYLYTGAWRVGERSPSRHEQNEDSYSVQADLVGRFITNFITPVQHRLLFAVDGNYQKNYQDERRATAAFRRNVLPGRTLSLDFHDPYYTPFDYNLLTIGAAGGNWEYINYQEKKLVTGGALASYRAILFESKLIAMASLRLDQYEDKYDNYRLDRYNRRKDDSLSYSAGLLYKIKGDRFLAYASTSTGFAPQDTADLGTGELVPPETSRGYEVGIKGATPNNNFGYTFSAYHVELHDVSYENPDYIPGAASGTDAYPQYIQFGKQRAKGIQASAFCRIEGGTYIRLTFGTTDAKTLDTNNDYARDKPMLNIPKWNGSVNFSREVKNGGFKGFRYGMGVTVRDDMIRDYETNNVYAVYLPSRTLFNAFVGYKWKSTAFWGPRAVQHNIGLNLNNLLSESYYLNGRRANGLTARLNYTLSY